MKKYPDTPEHWKAMPVVLTESELLVGGWQVMQTWEEPVMDRMAREITANGGDVLEVGFGMGISASKILKYGCRSYTVIEAHPEIAGLARDWKRQYETPITVIEGFWQKEIHKLPARYDGILFDTYPLSPDERHRNHFPFIPVARDLLRPQGILTYYSDETSAFNPQHLERVFAYFGEVKLIKVAGLQPPPDCKYWQHDHMIVPVAKRVR